MKKLLKYHKLLLRILCMCFSFFSIPGKTGIAFTNLEHRTRTIAGLSRGGSQPYNTALNKLHNILYVSRLFDAGMTNPQNLNAYISVFYNPGEFNNIVHLLFLGTGWEEGQRTKTHRNVLAKKELNIHIKNLRVRPLNGIPGEDVYTNLRQ